MGSTVKARVIHMHDTESNWNLLPEFIPKRGEIIIYDPDDTYPTPRFKIGDGETTLVLLPFGVMSVLDEIATWENNTGRIDAGTISSYL